MDIAETRAFVRKAHDGQRDKIGRPYVEHIERVADRVAAKLGALRERGVTIEPAQAQEIVTAALLHDVIEDCGLVADDLLNLGCPDAVVDTVLTLTRRKGEAYPEFIERIAASGNLGAMLIKLADVDDNLDPARFALLSREDAARLGPRYSKAALRLRQELQLMGMA